MPACKAFAIMLLWSFIQLWKVSWLPTSSYPKKPY
jgi:hypothetical protein